MKENPYVFRGPVHEAAVFFGRTHELNEIAAFLRGNQSISIVGPRKVGKTSLLFHLMRPETQTELGLGEGATGESTLFAYLDCEVLGEGGHEDIGGRIAGGAAEVPCGVVRFVGEETRDQKERDDRAEDPFHLTEESPPDLRTLPSRPACHQPHHPFRPIPTVRAPATAQ